MNIFNKFSDFGLSDYILKVPLPIKHAKVFPKNRHTCGDLLSGSLREHPNAFGPFRYFKKFEWHSLNTFESQDNLFNMKGASSKTSSEVTNDSSKTKKSEEILKNNVKEIITNELQTIIEQHQSDNFISNENFYNSSDSFNEQINNVVNKVNNITNKVNQITKKELSIQDVIKERNDISNNLDVDMLVELEKQNNIVQNISNTNIVEKKELIEKINNVEQKAEQHVKILHHEINDHKKALEKFLNS